MILYHGTSTEHLGRILQEGLLPRQVSGVVGNWEHAVPSKPFVYLSTAYAIYYASMAAGEGYEPVLLKVEVSAEDLYPEEDFIAYHLSDRTTAGWQRVTRHIEPENYQEFWADSLHRCGNVCIRSVPASAILAHRIVPMKENFGLLMDTGLDAMPTEINFESMGAYYEECVEAYFEHTLDEMPAVVAELYDDHMQALLGDEGYEQYRQQQEKLRLNKTPIKTSG